MNFTLSGTDVAALLHIAGEVNELPNDLQARREHILNQLLALVGGCGAACVEVDPKQAGNSGWAIPNTITLSGTMASHRHLADRYFTGRLAALDPCVPHLLRRKERTVTVRRTDVMDSSWFQSEHFLRLRRPLGLGESIYGKVTMPDGRRLKVSLSRELNDSPFTDREVQLLHIFNENLASLYAIGTSTPPADERMESLPPRLRPILRQLLAGDAEKQVAQKLGLSPHTIHEYTKALYRAFGVSSRGELLARFVTVQ